jgi:GntR family transcriptional regulator/MocR family aminotransferase
LLRLDRDAGTLGAQLQDQLRDAIRTGRLAGGERLPSSRTLARELGVSRGLVVDSYAQLEAEGYLDSVSGSATRVASCATAPVGATRDVPAAAKVRIDFEYGTPDLESFPMRDWLWALGEAAREAPAESLANMEHRGARTFREVIAAYLGRVRGAVVEPDNVIVCAGFGQGIGLAAQVLAARGVTTVAMEDPRWLKPDPAIERAGLHIVSVPVDERGLDVAALAATDARAVVVTPAHQCPTGVVLAPERRQQLVAWANERDGFIVEDDYDAEFRYDRQPVGALQGLAPERVIGIGSVSKSLAPSLRLGWIASPCALADDLAREKSIADRGSSGLDQLALAHLMRSGRYDRHLRKMRGVYGERRRALIAAVAEHAPAVEVAGLAAGIHAVLRLPGGVDETRVVEGARGRGVGLYGMSQWRVDGATAPAEVVVGFGNVTASQITRGIVDVADLLSG